MRRSGTEREKCSFVEIIRFPSTCTSFELSEYYVVFIPSIAVLQGLHCNGFQGYFVSIPLLHGIHIKLVFLILLSGNVLRNDSLPLKKGRGRVQNNLSRFGISWTSSLSKALTVV